MALVVLSALSAVLLAPAASAWSFTLPSTPVQCQTLPITITGGTSPYTFTFLQFPSTDGTVSIPSIGSNASSWGVGRSYSTTLDLPNPIGANDSVTESGYMIFPAGSRLVVVGSDAGGFGSGGTSGVLVVGGSGTGGCLQASLANETAALQAYQYFPTSVSQCELQSAWYSIAIPYQFGRITVDTVVPLGSSYRTFGGNATGNASLADWYRNVNWQVDVTAGTEVAFVLGTEVGGPVLVSQLMTVQAGNFTCEAMGAISTSIALPTGTANSVAASPTGPVSNLSAIHTGSIAGGVVGGVCGALLLAALALFAVRQWNRSTRRQRQQAIGLAAWRHSGPEKFEKASWGRGYRDEPLEGDGDGERES
ncbi:hypothetical protein CALCODRAFT_499139 [Calocera cornea HHB12733]|uniref:Peptidase A1 domain-containing protein n=1 Tax=Calocera cornea HHB12733 TaxID=1353952 RepID=A0A165EIT3_9BASI|nr:hypothetical protein CALCODRAFT_499139 [Calocera cornea HHB12733]